MTDRVAALIGPFPQASEREAIERADVVIAVDRGLDRALGLGITPSIAVGDFDSVSDEGRRWADDPLNAVEVIEVAAEKDFTDLDLALRTCRGIGASSIKLYGFIGGRLDHQLAVLGVCARYAHEATIQMIGTGQTVRFLSSGQAATIDTGVRFSVVALGDGQNAVAEVSIEGAKYPLVRYPLTPLSDLGVSNLSKDHSTVIVHAGTIALFTQT